MTRLSQMAWGKDDSETGGIRGKFGKWLLKQALKLIPVEQLRVFHWYPNGYTTGNGGKQRVVISDDPVTYWGDHSSDSDKVYAVKHNEDGILGIFWLWTEARSAASLLSQEYEDYHFQEHVLNEEENRIQIAEDKIEDLDKNLQVESIPLYKDFNYDEWSEESRVINSDNVRKIGEVIEKREDQTLKQV